MRDYHPVLRFVLLASVFSVVCAELLLASTSVIEAKLLASDGDEGNNFGEHVAVDGDTLVATAPRAPNGEARDAGAAYVFVRDSETGSWMEQQKLVPGSSREYLQFGVESVAIAGDTIVVAATREGVEGSFQQGAAYVFTRTDDLTEPWVETQQLVDEGGRNFDYFGSSLALEGDLLAVGARGAGNGKVMIFERDRGGPGLWSEVTTIYDSDLGDGGDNENFGRAVSFDGDLLLVGASDADVSDIYENDGAAYLFARSTVNPDQWDLSARLTAHEAAVCRDGLTIVEFNTERPEDRQTATDCARSEESRSDHDDFGFTVALDGDTAVIGARFAEGENGEYSVGAAYVFERDSTSDTWLEVTKLTPSDASSYAYFGTAVALSEETAVVGAKGAAIGDKLGQGAIYIFERQSDGSWTESAKLIADDGFSGENYGQAVALGPLDMVVSANYADDYSGAVYVHPVSVLNPLEPVDPSGPGETPFPLTGELSDGIVVSHDSGAILGASDGAGLDALPVWIHDIDDPEEPRFVGATVVGLTYSVGAAETTQAAAGAAFSLALPVPADVDPTRLVAAALVGGESVFDDWTDGDFWVPVEGLLDAGNEFLFINLSALTDTGTTVTLLEDPGLAGLTSALGDDGSSDSEDETEDNSDEDTADEDTADEDPSDPEEPFFSVRCVGFSHDPSKCGPTQEQDIESELLTALATYREAGFKDPRLRSLVLGAYDAPPSYGPHPIWILNNLSGFCIAAFGLTGGSGGVYVAAAEDIYLCMDPSAGVTSWLRTVARHELFHAVQNAHSWHWSTPKANKWVIEGMATAVMGNQGPPKVERYTGGTSNLGSRRVDISLLDGAGETMIGSQPVHPHPTKIPYEAQDFWVHFVQENGLELGDLVVILDEGSSAEGVARVMTLPTLAEAYWSWVKDQVTKGLHWSSSCNTDRDTPGRVESRDYPSESPEFEGELAPLTSVVVTFSILEDVYGIIASAERAGGSENFDYKVYLRSEPDCEGLPDGKRTFESVTKYELITVVASNTNHQGPPISYKITLSEGDL